MCSEEVEVRDQGTEDKASESSSPLMFLCFMVFIVSWTLTFRIALRTNEVVGVKVRPPREGCAPDQGLMLPPYASRLSQVQGNLKDTEMFQEI